MELFLILYITDLYYKRVLQGNENDVNYSVGKLFFAFGLACGSYSPFRLGATIVLDPGTPSPEKSLEIIEKYKVTIFFATPMLYKRMLEVEARHDLSSLRLCLSGGEALPATIYHQWREKFGLDILDSFGSTETFYPFISNRPGKIKPGTTGIPTLGCELRSVDEEGNDVPVGQAGRLLIKGDSIAPFYWEKHEESKKAFIGEWHDTGDMYVRDEEGFWTYVGRGDDLIKTRGLWVSPAEVEDALMKHSAVKHRKV